eukprot:jgi/Mesvir1/2835/Mv13925-RA.1
MAAVRGALATVASTSFEHAAERAKDFFKEIAKAVPSIMKMYHLDDVTTKSQFLGMIADRFRKNAEITNPQARDIQRRNSLFVRVRDAVGESAMADEDRNTCGHHACLMRTFVVLWVVQVIDILVYKGREELEQILLQHKQRHHLLTKYISPKYEDAGLKELQSTKSDFLSRFYESN